MPRTNERRFIVWHETCKCLHYAIVCNNKQCWNKNKCRYECKELIDKGVRDKRFIQNPSKCECDECEKACNVGEYLDVEHCKCRKKLVDKLVDECTETIEEMKLAKITLTENENKNKCSSCKVCIAFLVIVFTIFIEITIYFVLLQLVFE